MKPSRIQIFINLIKESDRNDAQPRTRKRLRQYGTEIICESQYVCPCLRNVPSR